MAFQDAADWRYKGEGAANVVLDYHGSNAEFLGKVMRIRKARSGEDSKEGVLSEAERNLWTKWPCVASATDEEELRHAYVRDVMRPLLGREYVDAGVIFPVSREFLVALAENIREKRPTWRAKEADLDFSSRNVLLVCDHTRFYDLPDGLPTVSIEIKPKWGYLPKSQAIAAENLIKQEVSRFTMHQLLKFSEGKISQTSPYCPLDLFSGTREGIDKALRSLFKSPQNNLRVFVNGDRIFTGSIDGANDSTDNSGSLDFLETSLVGFMDCEKGQRLGMLQQLVVEVLYKSQALKKLLQAQQDDTFDIEGIIHVFYSYMQLDCPHCATEESARDIDSELQRLTTISGLHSLSAEEQKELLYRFLIAATAKDCSLMLALKPIEPTTRVKHMDTISCPSTGRSYLYKISFLDLDLKRLDKVPYYFHLDQSIVKFYAKHKSAK